MKVTVLGSGSSGGVPAVGTGWGACNPNNPKNYRMRPSILLDVADKRLLIDTSPDLRAQLLATDVKQLDGVLYTHAHADHLNGIDDLRGINRIMGAPIDIYCDTETLTTLKERFGYVLKPLPDGSNYYYKPVLHPTVIKAGDSFKVAGVQISVFDQDHGFSRTLGYRIGALGYSTDAVNLPDTSFEMLRGIDTWIIGCFTDREHPTHVHLEKALKWIERVRPRQAILTHLGPDLDFDQLLNSLPVGVFVAFDGMKIEISD